MSALVALCFQVSATPWRLMESLTTDWEDAKITTCPRRGVRRYHGRSDSMSCSRFLDLILVKTDLGSADAPTFSNYNTSSVPTTLRRDGRRRALLLGQVVLLLLRHPVGDGDDDIMCVACKYVYVNLIKYNRLRFVGSVGVCQCRVRSPFGAKNLRRNLLASAPVLGKLARTLSIILASGANDNSKTGCLISHTVPIKWLHVKPRVVH